MDPALMHDARLPEFEGPPVFMQSFIDFIEWKSSKFLYDEDIYSAIKKDGDLRKAAVMTVNTRTTDGHRWYCSVQFTFGNSMLGLLFPFGGEGPWFSAAPNCEHTPRYPAVYIAGELDGEFVTKQLQRLQGLLEEVRVEKGLAMRARFEEEQRRNKLVS